MNTDIGEYGEHIRLRLECAGVKQVVPQSIFLDIIVLRGRLEQEAAGISDQGSANEQC